MKRFRTRTCSLEEKQEEISEEEIDSSDKDFENAGDDDQQEMKYKPNVPLHKA